MTGAAIWRPLCRLESTGLEALGAAVLLPPIANVLAITKNTNLDGSYPFNGLGGPTTSFKVTRWSPVMQTLMLAGIIFGLAASVAWAAFLGFELFRVIGLMF